MNINLDEFLAVVATVDPDAYATGEQNSDYVDMRDFKQVMFIVTAGTLGTNATLDAQVEQAQDANGTGLKDITGKVITQLTEAGTDSDKQAIIVVRQEDLDRANNFTHARLEMTLGAATSDYGMVAVAGPPTYGPASEYDLSTVDEIVS